MRYIGIDYGTKRLGIAISDTAGSFAFPRDMIPNDAKAFEAIVQMIKDERADALVIGDTLTLNGGSNDITPVAESFVKRLTEFVTVPVYRIREAWSSQEAARFAPQGKKHDDSSAAAIILQRYLDSNTKSE